MYVVTKITSLQYYKSRGAVGRICPCAACKDEGGRFANAPLPQCQEHKVGEAKCSKKGGGCLSALSASLGWLFMRNCLSALVFSVLAWSVTTEWCFICTGLDWSKIGLASCRKRTGQSHGLPFGCLGSVIPVCLLAVCPLKICGLF